MERSEQSCDFNFADMDPREIGECLTPVSYTHLPVETTDLDPIFVDMNAIIESGKVVSKDSYPYFSGEYKSKFESDLQLFAATPEIGAEGLISMLDKDFSGISK